MQDDVPVQVMFPVVFDTSVLFAALTSESGASRQLLFAAYRTEIQPITCNYIIDEVVRNLTRKAPQAIPYFEQVLTLINWQFIELADDQVLDVSRTVEGKDAPIIASAIVANNATVVTFDRRHLLGMADVIFSNFGVRVVEPGEVLREIGTRSSHQ